ncbi:type VI secretion system baseplate subunit TssF [Hafnia alvei]|uniref:type VI secretion system baseplate subunit TssF n=1 Tax=Hafnia alvei TaxID=569 RepID=UPI00345D6DBF
MSFYHANGEILKAQLPPIVCQYLSWSPDASSVSANQIINTSESIPYELAVTNITPCSNSYFGVTNSHQHWRLLSLLSLNYLALRQVETLKELLRLFDFHPSNLSQSNIIQRCIDGIVSVDANPLDWLVKGNSHRGIAITLILDPVCYPNLGEMYQFATALCYALSISQSTNSFIHMDVINQQTNEQWHIGHVQGHHPML